MKRMNWTAQGRAGFSVVELLVVIAVVAVLMSVLLPSLSAAREEGRKIRCMANERQVGMGLVGYSLDWKGFYPYGTPQLPGNPPSYDPRTWWRWNVYPYMNLPQTAAAYTAQAPVFRCPSNPWPVFILNGGYVPPGTYALNYQTYPTNWSDSTVLYTPGKPINPMRLDRIKKPSENLQAGEVPNGAPGSFVITSPSVFGNTFNGEQLTYNGPFTVAPGPYTWPTTRSARYAMMMHGDESDPSWNALKSDGHVESERRTTVYKITNTTVLAASYWNGN